MTEATNTTAVAAPTKEEKIAKLQAQADKLLQRIDDIQNDRVTGKAKKEVYVPQAGDKVIATVGRNTATSQAASEEGTVIAVKSPEVGAEGKSRGGIQVRVRIKEGQFEEQVVTLYVSQLTKVVDERLSLKKSFDDGSSAVGMSDPV